MITCQKHQFSIAEDIHFINCATFSPTSLKVQAAGQAAIEKLASPEWIKADDFIFGADNLRKLICQLINTVHPDRIAMMPAVSYGMATVAANLHRLPKYKKGLEVLNIDAEFPDHTYGFEQLVRRDGLQIKHISKPENTSTWSEQIISSITESTAAVVVPHVHWVLGVVFDLPAISDAIHAVGGLLVIDGTQSVGALPISVAEIQPDALLVAGYKWLMAPYTTGFAYYGPFFDEGVPLEESWMNRQDSQNFQDLTNLKHTYRSGAQRYNNGQYTNFNTLPMLEASIQELLEWQPQHIQNYCKTLIDSQLSDWSTLGLGLDEPELRASHLVGIEIPARVDMAALSTELKTHQVHVAMRGSHMRVSPHLYNTTEDLFKLTEVVSRFV